MQYEACKTSSTLTWGGCKSRSEHANNEQTLRHLISRAPADSPNEAASSGMPAQIGLPKTTFYGRKYGRQDSAGTARHGSSKRGDRRRGRAHSPHRCHRPSKQQKNAARKATSEQ